MIDKRNQYGIYSEVRTFDDAPHSFWLFDPWFEGSAQYVVRFLDRVFADPPFLPGRKQ